MLKVYVYFCYTLLFSLMAVAGFVAIKVLLGGEFFAAGFIALLGYSVWSGSTPFRASYKDILNN